MGERTKGTWEWLDDAAPTMFGIAMLLLTFIIFVQGCQVTLDIDSRPCPGTKAAAAGQGRET